MDDHDNNIDPATAEHDRRIMVELEKLFHTQEAAVPSYEPPRRVERQHEFDKGFRRIGRGVLNFFIKEKILFFRIIDDEKPARD